MMCFKRFFAVALALGFIITIMACAATTESALTGGTETGSTDPDTNAAHIGSAAEALVLSVEDSGSGSSLSAALTRYVIDGTSADWDLYLDSDNSYVLTDIFGSADVEPRVVTKLRVLIDQFQGTVDTLVGRDPDFECDEAEALSDQGDTIEISFYGEIDNGAADDRAFDCVVNENETEGEEVVIVYGVDDDGAIHFAKMGDSLQTNTQETATRGDQTQFYVVKHSTYAEVDEGGETVGYLDLNFSHASVYNGPDDAFGTADDVVFKSRSRITGRVTLDDDGDITGGAGEFNVIKFDAGQNQSNSTYEIVTQTMGRGDFTSGGYALFAVDSDVDGVEDADGTYCIQTPTDGSGLPLYADATNCTALETAFAWGTATFPFDLAPAIAATFEDNDFFKGDDVDMIETDGGNFTLPTY